MLRGEIWIAVWPNDPNKKGRPVLIVSNNHRNSAPNILDIVVVKLTGLHRNDGSKKIVNAAEDIVMTFKKETLVRCASIYSIEKSTLQNKVTRVSIQTMRQVDEKLRCALDLI